MASAISTDTTIRAAMPPAPPGNVRPDAPADRDDDADWTTVVTAW